MEIRPKYDYSSPHPNNPPPLAEGKAWAGNDASRWNLLHEIISLVNHSTTYQEVHSDLSHLSHDQLPPPNLISKLKAWAASRYVLLIIEMRTSGMSPARETPGTPLTSRSASTRPSDSTQSRKRPRSETSESLKSPGPQSPLTWRPASTRLLQAQNPHGSANSGVTTNSGSNSSAPSWTGLNDLLAATNKPQESPTSTNKSISSLREAFRDWALTDMQDHHRLVLIEFISLLDEIEIFPPSDDIVANLSGLVDEEMNGMPAYVLPHLRDVIAEMNIDIRVAIGSRHSQTHKSLRQFFGIAVSAQNNTNNSIAPSSAQESTLNSFAQSLETSPRELQFHEFTLNHATRCVRDREGNNVNLGHQEFDALSRLLLNRGEFLSEKALGCSSQLADNLIKTFGKKAIYKDKVAGYVLTLTKPVRLLCKGFELDLGKRCLLGPDGNEIFLEYIEFEFLGALMSNPWKDITFGDLLRQAALPPGRLRRMVSLRQYFKSIDDPIFSRDDRHRWIAAVTRENYDPNSSAPVHRNSGNPAEDTQSSQNATNATTNSTANVHAASYSNDHQIGQMIGKLRGKFVPSMRSPTSTAATNRNLSDTTTQVLRQLDTVNQRTTWQEMIAPLTKALNGWVEGSDRRKLWQEASAKIIATLTAEYEASARTQRVIDLCGRVGTLEEISLTARRCLADLLATMNIDEIDIVTGSVLSPVHNRFLSSRTPDSTRST